MVIIVVIDCSFVSFLILFFSFFLFIGLHLLDYTIYNVMRSVDESVFIEYCSNVLQLGVQRNEIIGYLDFLMHESFKLTEHYEEFKAQILGFFNKVTPQSQIANAWGHFQRESDDCDVMSTSQDNICHEEEEETQGYQEEEEDQEEEDQDQTRVQAPFEVQAPFQDQTRVQAPFEDQSHVQTHVQDQGQGQKRSIVGDAIVGDELSSKRPRTSSYVDSEDFRECFNILEEPTPQKDVLCYNPSSSSSLEKRTLFKHAEPLSEEGWSLVGKLKGFGNSQIMNMVALALQQNDIELNDQLLQSKHECFTLQRQNNTLTATTNAMKKSLHDLMGMKSNLEQELQRISNEREQECNRFSLLLKEMEKKMTDDKLVWMEEKLRLENEKLGFESDIVRLTKEYQDSKTQNQVLLETVEDLNTKNDAALEMVNKILSRSRK